MNIIEKKQGVIFKLRANRLIRILVYPYMNYKRKKKVKDYAESKDAKYVKSLKNTKVGKRCFVIGNGPSLLPSDLDKLKGEDTFAFNRIFFMFDKTDWRPTYYMCVDADVLEMNKKEICELNLPCVFLGRRLSDSLDERFHLICDYTRFTVNKWNFSKPYVSEEVSDHFCSCYSVTFEALQFALYMGYTEIYLLGVDHNYSVKVDSKGKVTTDGSVKDYFEGLNKTDITVMNYDATTAAFQSVQDYCEKTGKAKVFNATRGGKLEVYPRIRFDDINFD